MSLACCFIGTALLILSIILSAITDGIWVAVLIAGEIISFLGYAPLLLKLFG